jgi:hypothetical protein
MPIIQHKCLISIPVIHEGNCINSGFVQALIEEADVVLDTIAGVSPAHARYYDLCSKFYKVGQLLWSTVVLHM